MPVPPDAGVGNRVESLVRVSINSRCYLTFHPAAKMCHPKSCHAGSPVNFIFDILNALDDSVLGLVGVPSEYIYPVLWSHVRCVQAVFEKLPRTTAERSLVE